MTIIAEHPNTGEHTADAIHWKSVLEALDTKVAGHTKGKKKPIENLWQLPAEPGLKILLEILPLATRAEVRLAVRISDEPLDLMILP
jgi:hypothetical protein